MPDENQVMPMYEVRKWENDSWRVMKPSPFYRLTIAEKLCDRLKRSDWGRRSLYEIRTVYPLDNPITQLKK